MERSGVLPTTQFVYRKGLDTCAALCACPIHYKVHCRVGRWLSIVQIDFSTVFCRVNHQGILYKRCCVGIEDSVLSILSQFLSNRSQYVKADGCQSKLVNVLRVPLHCVLGTLLFLLYTSKVFSILDHKLICHANDSTLMAGVPPSGVRVAVSESVIRDLGRDSEWCDTVTFGE